MTQFLYTNCVIRLYSKHAISHYRPNRMAAPHMFACNYKISSFQLCNIIYNWYHGWTHVYNGGIKTTYCWIGCTGEYFLCDLYYVESSSITRPIDIFQSLQETNEKSLNKKMRYESPIRNAGNQNVGNHRISGTPNSKFLKLQVYYFTSLTITRQSPM